MKNQIVSGLEAIEHLLLPPEPACAYVKQFFEKKGIIPAKVAEVIGVSRSTVTRFLNGGMLSEEMAAKLGMHYNLPINLLFKLEAKAHVYKAEQLMKQLVA
ncbi:MAG: helix-turn-helix transcriptional regulator [Alteromonadaceae bacterium]|nr:helix-turn-helix transcriptional regulator [Alteromonadaceae bacterium]